MNYIKHLAGFFERVATDDRLNPTHISMYVSLFQFWNASHFQNPISISRSELMKISKICAKATYHKCMRELNDWQYLKYKPSFNPFKGSLVYLFNLGTGTEQELIAHHAKISTGAEQALAPYINALKRNKQNLINLDEPIKKNEVQNLNSSFATPPELHSGEAAQKRKADGLPEVPNAASELRQKKKKAEALLAPQKKMVAPQMSPSVSTVPTLPSSPKEKFTVPLSSQVQEYFEAQKYPLLEAQKFFNYFQSNGWLVGGRTKMKDWKAAARNWMLNAKKFTTANHTPARHLHTSQTKNYNEPL